MAVSILGLFSGLKIGTQLTLVNSVLNNLPKTTQQKTESLVSFQSRMTAVPKAAPSWPECSPPCCLYPWELMNLPANCLSGPTTQLCPSSGCPLTIKFSFLKIKFFYIFSFWIKNFLKKTALLRYNLYTKTAHL